VRNISRGGVNLEVGRPFHPGELLSVSLPGAADQDGCAILACVVHCTPAADCWQLGCTFAAPLDNAELARFRPGAAQEAIDQRARERFACRARAVYTVVGGAEARQAEVLNISANGVALLGPASLQVGQLLSVELRPGEGEPVVTTLASVVRTMVEPNGDRIVGCNFINELTEAQFRMLL
jgi:hypothetical protein